jgi:uncharacterized protein (DUF2141 family)
MSLRMSARCLSAIALTFWSGNARSEENSLSNTPPLAEQKDPPRGDLQVRVERTRNTQGQICVSLFATTQGFPADARTAVATLCVRASELQTGSVTFDDIPWGTYAVAMFHDENFDGKLNLGIFGIPAEGFGFSNNPGLRVGAPGFQECAFNLNDENQSVVIDLRYLL